MLFPLATGLIASRMLPAPAILFNTFLIFIYCCEYLESTLKPCTFKVSERTFISIIIQALVSKLIADGTYTNA